MYLPYIKIMHSNAVAIKKSSNAIGFSHDLHIIYNFMKPL